MTAIVGVLLAGGLGRRIGGGDKPLRMLGGETLLRHAIDRVRPQVAALALNANGDPARLAAYGLDVVPDTLPDTPGPLAGVLAGMRFFASAYRGGLVLSVPTDTPFLPRDLVARLLAARGSAAIALAASGGRTHPVAGIWPVSLADDLEAWLLGGGRKVESWAARHGVALAEFPCDPFDPFFNVNTLQDLAEAARFLKSV